MLETSSLRSHETHTRHPLSRAAAALAVHLGRVLPCVLDGLSDEGEGVRDAALAAGRTIVDHYANSALALLLPAVEDGVLNDSWRIRQASVKLLGKLLFKVGGAAG